MTHVSGANGEEMNGGEMNGQDNPIASGGGSCRPVETVAWDAERKAYEAYRLAMDNKQTLTALLALIGEVEPEEKGLPLKGHPSTVMRATHGDDCVVMELGLQEHEVAAEMRFNGKEPWMEPGKRVLIYVQEVDEA